MNLTHYDKDQVLRDEVPSFTYAIQSIRDDLAEENIAKRRR